MYIFLLIELIFESPGNPLESLYNISLFLEKADDNLCGFEFSYYITHLRMTSCI